MHLLLIHQAFLSASQAGGTRHYEFARHCVDRGHEVTVVASDVDYLSGERIEGPREAEVDGIRVRRVHMISRIHRSFVWRVIAFLSFMVNAAIEAFRADDVDVVVGTSPPLFQALSAAVVAGLRRRPFLLEIRDLWPDFAIDMGVLTNPILIWLARRLESFLYRRATHIVVNSPAYRDHLRERGIPAAKLSLIPNGVDPAMFDPDERGSEVRKEFGIQGRFVAVYAGAIGPANDIPVLVHAAEQLRDDEDFRLLLVGDGKARPNIEELIASKGLRNVVMAGPRPKSAMKEVLGAADVCVATLLPIPMFATTYPNKIFDYMAAGRPIVLGIDGVIREVVEEADAGIFVPPGDPGAMAEAIARLKAEPGVGREMGRRGREFVARHFNRNQQAADFLELARLLTEKRIG